MTIALNAMMEFALLPAMALVLGTALGSVCRIGPKLSSAVQHFAAGVIFAAVALELIPKLDGSGSWLRVAVCFSLGVLVMIGLNYFSDRLENAKNGAVGPRMPWGLLLPVSIDLWIDGLLMGIAFLVGVQGGKLIALALCFETLFLGFALAAMFQARAIRWLYRCLLIFGLGLLLPLGTVIGAFVMAKISPLYMVEWIAFGVAALLFLVTEELLQEAHQRKDTPWVTATFFLGFLIILLLKDVF